MTCTTEFTYKMIHDLIQFGVVTILAVVLICFIASFILKD